MTKKSKPTVDLKRLNRLFVKSVKRIASDLDKPECEVTKAEFFRHDEEGFNDWDIRRAGGFTSLRAMHFPPIEDEDLEVKYGSKLVSAEIAKVKREHGKAMFFESSLLKGVEAALKQQPLSVHAPVPLKKLDPNKMTRTIVADLSDTHYGANISKGEMHGVNEFNWLVASRRTAYYFEQIALYKLDKRSETDLVLQVNGDIIAGLIHDTEWFVDLLLVQFTGALHLLVQGISYLAQHFHRVRVVFTPGNHGRNMAKSNKGRATTHKWDSYETMLGMSVKAALAPQHKNVEVIVPESPFALYQVQGHWVFQSHGDTVVNVGNPGKSISMDSISNQINKANASDLLPGKEKISVLSVGHVHVPTVQLTDSGSMVVINGCLSGLDPFAQSIGIHSNNPTQVLYEATPDHAVGDIRMIKLKAADKEERFDQIIGVRPTFSETAPGVRKKRGAQRRRNTSRK